MSLKHLIHVSALSALALFVAPGLAGSASFGYFGELGRRSGVSLTPPGRHVAPAKFSRR